MTKADASELRRVYERYCQTFNDPFVQEVLWILTADAPPFDPVDPNNPDNMAAHDPTCPDGMSLSVVAMPPSKNDSLYVFERHRRCVAVRVTYPSIYDDFVPGYIRWVSAPLSLAELALPMAFAATRTATLNDAPVGTS